MMVSEMLYIYAYILLIYIYSSFKKVYLLKKYLFLINVCIVLLGIMEDTKMGATDPDLP